MFALAIEFFLNLELELLRWIDIQLRAVSITVLFGHFLRSELGTGLTFSRYFLPTARLRGAATASPFWAAPSTSSEGRPSKLKTAG